MSLFHKFKSFAPIAVVGSAVAITVKLLTTQTPVVEDTFNVSLEEDIQTTSYEDQIVIPEPEPEPKEEEALEEEQVTEDTEQDEGEEEESESPSEGEGEQEEQKQEKQNQKKEQPARKWKTGNQNSVVSIFQRLLSKDKK